MAHLAIHIPDGRTGFDPGETIDVELTWDLDQPPESFELRTVWNTSGKGTTDLGIARRLPFEDSNLNGSRLLSVTLPPSPYSFSGQLITLIWALEFIAFPGKKSTRTEITIAPGGEEVRLTSVPDADSQI